MRSEVTVENFKAFSGQPALCSLDGMAIENNQNRVSLYGSLNITQDRQGLALAKQMQALLDHVVNQLQQQHDLPEKIENTGTEEVNNPFL